jgi:hypothetical protein
MSPSSLLRNTLRSARWPGRAALFGGAFVVGLAPASDGDLWWHLAAGREILAKRSLLTVDSFSVSATGRPWVDVHWLFQVAAYGVHCVGGLTALVVAKCLLVALGASLLGRAVEREAGSRAAFSFAAIFLAALFAARSLLLLRPVLVTLVLLALFFLQLERFRRDGRWLALLPLPVAQIVWANCQGLFPLGLALVGAYLLGNWANTRSAVASQPVPEMSRAHASPPWDRTGNRALTVTLLLCALACCATPYGLHALFLPLELLGRLLPGHGNVYAANVVENAPPLAPEQALAFWHLKWFFGFLVVSFALAGRRLVLAHALLVTALTLLALLCNRNVLLLYWIATPIAVMSAWQGARRSLALARRRRSTWVLARWGSGSALVALLVLLFATAWIEPALARPAPFRAPIDSARILGGRPGRGTIFAADEYGGYLIWNLYPRYRPYIDTRLVLRTPAEFAEYLDVVDHPDRFDDFQRTHGFDYVVLPVTYPDRYLGLIGHLYSSPQWKLVFGDGSETLFARRENAGFDSSDMGSPSTTDRLLGSMEERFGNSPHVRDASRLGLATLDITLRQFGEAERVLAPISSPEARALRARSRLAAGDLLEAKSLGERLLKEDGGDVRSLNLLALVSLRLGEPKPALTFLRRAVAADPFDLEAERILSSLEEHADVH